MGVRDSWNELGTGGKVLVGVVVGGVVLVVGLVLLVVLAAVVGSFVLGMGESSTVTAPPEVGFSASYEAESETFELTHDGGESIAADSLTVDVDGRTAAWEDDDGTVTDGDSTTVEASSGATVRVIFDDGDDSMVLFRGAT